MYNRCFVTLGQKIFASPIVCLSAMLPLLHLSAACISGCLLFVCLLSICLLVCLSVCCPMSASTVHLCVGLLSIHLSALRLSACQLPMSAVDPFVWCPSKACQLTIHLFVCYPSVCLAAVCPSTGMSICLLSVRAFHFCPSDCYQSTCWSVCLFTDTPDSKR